jgi:hypothetical protein
MLQQHDIDIQTDLYINLLRVAHRISSKCIELNAESDLEKEGIAQVLLGNARKNACGIPYFDTSSLTEHDGEDDMDDPTCMDLYLSETRKGKQYDACISIQWKPRYDAIIPSSFYACGLEIVLEIDEHNDVLHMVELIEHDPQKEAECLRSAIKFYLNACTN